MADCPAAWFPDFWLTFLPRGLPAGNRECSDFLMAGAPLDRSDLAMFNVPDAATASPTSRLGLFCSSKQRAQMRELGVQPGLSDSLRKLHRAQAEARAARALRCIVFHSFLNLQMHKRYHIPQYFLPHLVYHQSTQITPAHGQSHRTFTVLNTSYTSITCMQRGIGHRGLAPPCIPHPSEATPTTRSSARCRSPPAPSCGQCRPHTRTGYT